MVLLPLPLDSEPANPPIKNPVSSSRFSFETTASWTRCSNRKQTQPRQAMYALRCGTQCLHTYNSERTSECTLVMSAIGQNSTCNRHHDPCLCPRITSPSQHPHSFPHSSEVVKTSSHPSLLTTHKVQAVEAEDAQQVGRGAARTGTGKGSRTHGGTGMRGLNMILTCV